MPNKIHVCWKKISDNAEAFISGLNWTDKKIMEYGMYLFVIVLFIGAAGIFKFIGIYLPALIFFIRFCLRGSTYRFWESPIFIGLVLFAISGILSVFSSRNIWQSMVFFEKYHIRSLLIYFVVVTAFQNRKAFLKLVNLAALTSIIYIAWSYSIYGIELIRHGTFVRLNILNAAWPLMYILPFVIMKVFVSRSKRGKLFWVAVGFLSAISLILSGQRATVLGMLVVFGIWFLYMNRRVKLVLIGCVLLIAVFIVLLPQDFPAIQDYTTRGVSSDGRAQLLEVYWQIFQKHFWLGIGLDNDNMRYVYDQTKKAALIYQYMMPHNTFLTTGVRQGVVGLLTFCFVLFSAIIGLARKLKRRVFDEQKAVGIALLSGLTGMYVAYAVVTEIVLMPFALLLAMSAVFINNASLRQLHVNK